MSNTTEYTNSKKVFQSYMSYWEFSKKVKWEQRYLFQQDVQDFLDTVIYTCVDRKTKINKNSILWRAQIGYEEDINNHDMPIPFPFKRMKPLKNRAKEGRANPKGIPYLYLATDTTTAISEVRAWQGSLVSTAKFIVNKDVNIIDCSNDILYYPNFHWEEPSDSMKELHVWSDVNEAYSIPVNDSDDTADYVPTQILTELFKNHGFEGVAYKSSLAEGHNLVLFDIDSIDTDYCELHEVKNIMIEHDQCTNPIYRENKSTD